MLMFIIQAILIVAVLAVFIGAGLYKDDYGDFAGWKPKKKCILALIPLGIWVLTLSVAFVPANTVGVKWSAFGGTSETTLNEGVTLKIPFADKILSFPLCHFFPVKS